MSIETRLQNMYRYRDEAMLDPIANELYLEDLAISIPMFEKAVQQNKKSVVPIKVLNGFPIDD